MLRIKAQVKRLKEAVERLEAFTNGPTFDRKNKRKAIADELVFLAQVVEVLQKLNGDPELLTPTLAFNQLLAKEHARR